MSSPIEREAAPGRAVEGRRSKTMKDSSAFGFGKLLSIAMRTRRHVRPWRDEQRQHRDEKQREGGGLDDHVPPPGMSAGRRRAVTSISIRMRGSARPAEIIVAAGRTSPKYRRKVGQQRLKSFPAGST